MLQRHHYRPTGKRPENWVVAKHYGNSTSVHARCVAEWTGCVNLLGSWLAMKERLEFTFIAALLALPALAWLLS